MKTIRVSVTKRDIAVGKRGSSYECPIALACRRLGKRWIITIDAARNAKSFKWIANMPDKAQRFIERFDKGRPVRPFTFTLKMP